MISFPFNSFSLAKSYMTHTTKPCTEKLSLNTNFFKFLTGMNDETIFLNISRHKLHFENNTPFLQSNTIIIIIVERNRNI